MSRFTPFALLLAGALVVGVGCKKDEQDHMKSSEKTSMSAKPLWDRLGGQKAVEAVVDDFVVRAANDTKNVNFTRAGHPNQWDPSPANMQKFKTRLVEFISLASGGPLKYKGKDMTSAHTGMEITSAEFQALANHLSASLDKFKVPAKEKNELLTAVAGTKDQIVGK
jgi:hemoglobin